MERRLSKGKGYDRQESQVGLNKSRPFNVVKEAAKQTKETEAKSSQERTQKSDVGSSSGLSKVVDIPAGFGHIGGNTDLANAKVILLGEFHTHRHCQEILKFIKTHANDGDIVLVEGWRAKSPMPYSRYKISMPDLDSEDKPPKLTQHIKMYGWDDMKALNATVVEIKKSFKNLEKICKIYLKRKNIEGINEKNIKEINSKLSEEKNKYYTNSIESSKTVFELHAKRDEKMLKTIKEMRNKSPDSKIFVVAGKWHFRGYESPRDIEPKRQDIESAIQENLESTKTSKSMAIEVYTSLQEKALKYLKQKSLRSLIQENLNNQLYIGLEPEPEPEPERERSLTRYEIKKHLKMLLGIWW